MCIYICLENFLKLNNILVHVYTSAKDMFAWQVDIKRVHEDETGVFSYGDSMVNCKTSLSLSLYIYYDIKNEAKIFKAISCLYMLLGISRLYQLLLQYHLTYNAFSSVDIYMHVCMYIQQH